VITIDWNKWSSSPECASGILASTYRAPGTNAARKEKAAVTKSGLIDPVSNRIPRLLGDFELDRPPRFLLNRNGSGLDTAAHRDVIDL
jgi:hypothetical protein